MITPRRLLMAGIILGLIALGFVFSDPLRALRTPIHTHPYLGIGLFIGVLALVTIFPVASSLVLLPVAGAVWGLIVGSIYALFGWWLGGLIAFAIARRGGRRLLERYISFRKLDAWEERIPADIGFLGMIYARILLPPGVVSYTVGLMRNIPARRFALATLIGGIPISFFLVGLGSAVAADSPLIFVAYGLCIVLLLIGAYAGIWRRWQKAEQAQESTDGRHT